MYRYSGKMIFLLNLLIECKKHNEKVIVFSRWLHALSLVEDLLMSYNSKLRDSDSYKKFRFRRFDGSTGIEDRKCIISQLTPTNPQEIDVLILSTLCGEGINLSEASRVVIMDVNWNPNHDLQAALRVFRYGQTRPIFIYRLVSDDTMEQKVFFRQMHKVELSNWIVDESTNSLVETSMDSNSLKQLFLKPVKNDCLTSEVAYCIEAVNDSITRSALNESTYHLNGRSYSWISSCEVFDSFFETERVEDSPEHDLLNTLEEIHWHVTYDRKSDKINSSRDRNPDLKSRVRSSSSSDLDTISMTPRKRATEAEAFRRK